jgi:hypothetical protein
MKIKDEKTFGFDLFSTVLLIIAGPAVGAILRAFHRAFQAIYFYFRNLKTREKRLNDWAEIRAKLDAEQKLEIDRVDSEYDFRISIAITLIGMSIVYMLNNVIIDIERIGMLIVGGLMFYGGILIYKQRWVPLFKKLQEIAKKKN